MQCVSRSFQNDDRILVLHVHHTVLPFAQMHYINCILQQISPAEPGSLAVAFTGQRQSIFEHGCVIALWMSM